MNTHTKKKYKVLEVVFAMSFVILIALSMFSIAPQSAYACGNPTEPPCPLSGGGANVSSGGGSNTNPNATPNSKTDISINTGIKNPLGEKIKDIPTLIGTILNFVLLVGVPIITLAIIYAGFLFVTAAGNSEKLTTAKKTLLYTLIGAALLLGSYVIAQAIKGTVDEITNANK